MTDRYIRVKLANPEHKMPMPGLPRLFGEFEMADTYNAFWLCLLADGSVVQADEDEAVVTSKDTPLPVIEPAPVAEPEDHDA